MTLFDPGPAQPVPELSAWQRMRARQEAVFANGAHPITRYPLAGNGETCKTCAHRYENRHGRTYHKCEYNDSHCQATDLVLSWPACARWEPIEEGG